MKRRDVLKSILAMGVGATSLSATAGQLQIMNALSQQARHSDFKALVCIFLYGGNDSYNMLVPTEAQSYQQYAQVRQNLAVEQSTLLSLNTTTQLPYALGVPDYMSPVAELFHSNQLAFVNNVGPLVEPTTKSAIQSSSANLPPQLFSHNDQQRLWEQGNNSLVGTGGWAGRVADLLDDVNPQSSIPLNISLAGNNVLQTGNRPLYAMTAEGADMFGALNPEHDWNERRISVFDRLIQLDSHNLGGAYRSILNGARSKALVVNQGLEAAPRLTTEFADNSLHNDLAMVAKMISIREQLGMQRQIYFVGYGGWDTHDQQNDLHPELLSNLASAMQNFNAAMTELGLEQQVTTFTASEFGRTLTSNGDGTDHGWGGHQMVMGGAVNGGQLYGQMPSLSLNSEDDFGEGRIIPTTSSEQYAATLARWFGLSDSELELVFPLLSRFDQPTLSFI